MTIAHAHLAPWAPGFNPAMRANRAIDDRPGIQQEATCYQWFKQRLILSISKPSVSQRSQIKEDTVKLSVPARELNLKTYAAITWHNDPASLGFKPRLSDHRSQAARTAMLTTMPPGQAKTLQHYFHNNFSHRGISNHFLRKAINSITFALQHTIPEQELTDTVDFYRLPLILVVIRRISIFVYWRILLKSMLQASRSRLRQCNFVMYFSFTAYLHLQQPADKSNNF